jgi:preprotein translocase subunit SecG
MSQLIFDEYAMYQIILIVHIILSLAIIGLVLVQRGKGAEMGAGFGGGGASQSVFGSSGSSSFLTRATSWLATGFFISCLALSYLAVHLSQNQTAEYLPEVPTEEATPAAAAAMPVGDIPAVPVATETATATLDAQKESQALAAPPKK